VEYTIEFKQFFMSQAEIGNSCDWVQFKINNWRSNDFLFVLNHELGNVGQKGAALWLNTKGDIVFRVHMFGDIFVSSASKASIVLSNVLKIDIKIREKTIPYEKRDSSGDTHYIYTNESLANSPFQLSGYFCLWDFKV